MPRHPTITKARFLKVVQVFHFFTRDQAVLFFKGHTGRDKRVETLLPEFVKKRKLISYWHDGRKVYSAPRKGRLNIEHGLACTECLIRLSFGDTQIIPEKKFKTFQAVPEWAIIFPGGVTILFEFSTQDNFSRGAHMRRKIRKYEESITQIEKTLGLRVAVILFVCDVSRNELFQFIESLDCSEDFLFCDYETFKSVPLGENLTTPIYIWSDGESYPLTDV